MVGVSVQTATVVRVTAAGTTMELTVGEARELHDALSAQLASLVGSDHVGVGDIWDAIIDGEPPAHVLMLDDGGRLGVRYLHRVKSGWWYSDSREVPLEEEGWPWDVANFNQSTRRMTVVKVRES